MAIYKFTNNAASKLAQDITAVETSVSVTAGDGAQFPTLDSNHVFDITLVDEDGNLEIIQVTSVTGDTFTVERGRDGTTPRAFSAGSSVQLRITAEELNSFAEAATAPADLANATGMLDVAHGGTGSATGEAPSATKLATARTVSLTGAVTGSVLFDGSTDITLDTASSIEISEYQGATDSSAGVAGLVPPATPAEKGYVLHGDGTWKEVKSGGAPTITTPTILTPVENAAIMLDGGNLTVTSSELMLSFGTGVHEKSDWKLTSDAAGEQVIQESLDNTTDKTSHVFTGLDFTYNTQVYIWVRYYVLGLEVSDWSIPRNITISTMYTTAGGRKLYRHSSNQGSVLEINDAGTVVKLFIADAKYRDRLNLAKGSLKMLEYYSSIPTGMFYDDSISTESVATLEQLSSLTDAQLNKHFTSSKRDKSTSLATTNTVCAAGDASAYPAFWYCKNINIDGVGTLAIPNIQLLVRIHCEALAIDAIDPTTEAYPNNTLVYIWPASITNTGSLSCTPENSSYFFGVNAGTCLTNDKDILCMIIPVRELS